MNDTSDEREKDARPEVAALLQGEPLPRPPEFLDPDSEAIVAVWREGDRGAVMTIWRDPDGNDGATPDDEDWPFNVDIETYERLDGRWRYRGAGGSDSPVPYGERLDYPRPALTGFGSGCGRGADLMLWTGIAPKGVERVEARMAGVVQVVPVEAVSGAFMVAFPYPGPDPSDLTSEGGR